MDDDDDDGARDDDEIVEHIGRNRPKRNRGEWDIEHMKMYIRLFSKPRVETNQKYFVSSKNQEPEQES